MLLRFNRVSSAMQYQGTNEEMHVSQMKIPFGNTCLLSSRPHKEISARSLRFLQRE